MPRLPADPSLEHLKNQAKTLLRPRPRAVTSQARAGCASSTPTPRRRSPFKLADAQLVVARAYGFPSWPKLHAHLDWSSRLSPRRRTRRRGPSTTRPDGGVPAPRLPRPTPTDDPAPRGSGGGAPAHGPPELARGVAAQPRPPPVTSRAARACSTRATAGGARARAARTAGSRCCTSPYSRRDGPTAALGGRAAAARARRRPERRASSGTACLRRSPRSPAPSGAARATRRRTADALALARLLLEAGADPTDTQATLQPALDRGRRLARAAAGVRLRPRRRRPWHARLGARPPDAARDRRGLPDVGRAAGLPAPRRRCCSTPASTPTAGHRHPILKGRTALEVALLEGHTEVAQTPCGRPAPASRSSSAPSASRPPTWPPTGRHRPAAARPDRPRGRTGQRARGRAAAQPAAPTSTPSASAPPRCTRPPCATTPPRRALLAAGADRTLRDRQFGATPSAGPRTPATPSWPSGSPPR